MKARARSRGRRHVRRPPDLTSLFDVLFIVVFVALIRAAAAEQAAADAAAPRPPPPPVRATPPGPPPAPAPVAVLRDRAVAQLSGELASRTPIVVRISPRPVVGDQPAVWQLDALELGATRIPLDLPLLEHHPDPDIGVAYLGERSAALRVCQIAALHAQAADLARHLVIVAPARPLADLPHALVEGLKNDVVRCAIEQRGTATIVDGAAPANESAP